MSDVEWQNLLLRITKEKTDARVKPVNMRFVSGSRSTKYIYEPVTVYGKVLYDDRRNIKSNNRPTDSGAMTTLAPSSFLNDEGYSINLNNTARQQILRTAVNRYGRRRVADHLRFLIATREGQRNGRTKFANAIRIWQSDLNYVARL